MPIQVNIWLLVFGGLQGLLLLIVLIRKKAHRGGYVFLILYLLVLLVQIFFKIADKRWLMQGLSSYYTLTYKLPLLYGPLIWMFVVNFAGKGRFGWNGFLHFAPFVYACLAASLDKGYGVLFWPISGIIGLIVQLASILFYHVAAMKIGQKPYNECKEVSSNRHLFRIRWVQRLVLWSLIICAVIAILSHLIYVWYPEHNWLRFGFLLLSVYIYGISYSLLEEPRVVEGGEGVPPVSTLPRLVLRKKTRKYSNSGLSDDEAARIIKEIEALMMGKRLYTDPLLTIDVLSGILHTNRHTLSQVLNERMGHSFYSYINSYRVEAAKEMLRDAAFQQYKMAAVGYDAGFNSLSAFNDVFKRITGLSPSQYKKQSLLPLQQRV